MKLCDNITIILTMNVEMKHVISLNDIDEFLEREYFIIFNITSEHSSFRKEFIVM